MPSARLVAETMTLLSIFRHNLHHRGTKAPRKASEKCEPTLYELMTVVDKNQECTTPSSSHSPCASVVNVGLAMREKWRNNCRLSGMCFSAFPHQSLRSWWGLGSQQARGDGVREACEESAVGFLRLSGEEDEVRLRIRINPAERASRAPMAIGARAKQIAEVR